MPPCDRAERPLPQNLSHCHPVRSSSFFHAELHTVEGQPFLPIPWGEMKENAILFLKVGVYGILDFLLAACGLLQWPSPRFRLCRGGAQVPGCRISRPVGAKGRVLAGAWRRGGGGFVQRPGQPLAPRKFPPTGSGSLRGHREHLCGAGLWATQHPPGSGLGVSACPLLARALCVQCRNEMLLSSFQSGILGAGVCLGT